MREKQKRRWQVMAMQALRRLLDTSEGPLTTRQQSMIRWLVSGEPPFAEHIRALRDLGVADWPVEVDDLAQVQLRKHESQLTMISELRQALEGEDV